MIKRPAWVEVNLDNVVHNLNEVKRVVKEGTKICPVIKADAYKQGVMEIAKTYIDEGVDMLAVAVLDEALEIRKELKDIPVLVLGYTPEEAYGLAIENDIILTIYTYEQGVKINEKCEELDRYAALHIKVETGMNRLGFLPTEKSRDEILELKKLQRLGIEGIYTHMARADEFDKTIAKSQQKRFNDFYDMLVDKGLEIPTRHISNSASIIDLPDFNYEMVRPGIMLTGLYPSDEVDRSDVKLKQTITLRAKIALVKTIEMGEGISYGHTFVTHKEMKVGTLPLGYADGFSRLLSGKMEVSVNGVRCRILGRICMDQCVVDLTDVPDARIGDEVIIYDDNRANGLNIDQVAELLGTINYEIVTMLDRRLPRVYTRNGEEVGLRNYLV
ncbi:alanine racemase [Dethiosulfatibacter aminovorans DSM 17477]|uniref:Alanine racemase n=1 Tax=Dethiosulfatibacter aminovorans DSM 17477 TaxID=1121476 RepID=A0A1M6ELS5_9FIRM|nr:alanine racemase [Dethiosulfatibacter aminovorans]SHI86423.1 alanine racemase [Dethiosulfatibacter aminovorans DSM 17477]